MVMALDREILTGKVMNGLYRPAYSIVPPLPGYAAVLPEWAGLSDADRHREAQRLYAAAGYSAARPLQVELWYPMADADTRRMLEAMAAMWRMNLGADVQLRNEEWRVHQQNRHIRKYRFFFDPWSGDYPDPLTFLGLPMPDSKQNYMDYHDAAYAAAVEAGERSTDPQMRQGAYHEAERILNAAAVLVPVYYYQTRHLLRSQVQGWQDNPMDRHSSRDLSLARSGSR
jgi:oligopeptide transport system substrate-binding protein